MHDDRAEAIQKCFSFKSFVTKRRASHLNITSLQTSELWPHADDFQSMLEWNPEVQLVARF